MWKKSEPEVSPQPTAVKRPAPARTEGSGPRKSRIGPGLRLKGELHSEEDVIIEGRVEGSITLKDHGVIVEESGRVDADVTASTICVAGEVHGNLHGTEQVVLLKTGRVEGDIFAKSVTLETGAQFKGSIDMEIVEATTAADTVEPAQKDATPSDKKTNGATQRLAAS